MSFDLFVGREWVKGVQMKQGNFEEVWCTVAEGSVALWLHHVVNVLTKRHLHCGRNSARSSSNSVPAYQSLSVGHGPKSQPNTQAVF